MRQWKPFLRVRLDNNGQQALVVYIPWLKRPFAMKLLRGFFPCSPESVSMHGEQYHFNRLSFFVADYALSSSTPTFPLFTRDASHPTLEYGGTDAERDLWLGTCPRGEGFPFEANQSSVDSRPLGLFSRMAHISPALAPDPRTIYTGTRGISYRGCKTCADETLAIPLWLLRRSPKMLLSLSSMYASWQK